MQTELIYQNTRTTKTVARISVFLLSKLNANFDVKFNVNCVFLFGYQRGFSIFHIKTDSEVRYLRKIRGRTSGFQQLKKIQSQK